MFISRRMSRLLVVGVLVSATGGGLVANAQAQNDVRVTILAGTVRDTGGTPIDTVLVEMLGGAALPTITLENGFYFLVSLNRPGDDATVRFTHDGFMRTLKRLPAQDQTTTVIRLDAVMKRTGAVQPIPLDTTTTVSEDTTKVTVEPGDLVDADEGTLTGNANVCVTPIDPSGGEIDLFPGFAASKGGQDIMIESFAAVDIEIMQGDQPANIASGKTLKVEFPIPDARQNQFTVGETLNDFLWSLNETTGVWEEGLSVTVDVSTTDPTKKAFFAEVPHLSTWNCDRPFQTTCLTGRVVDLSTGSGIPGAVVRAEGLDYSGRTVRVTDAEGKYCIPVKSGAQVRLTADAIGFTSAPLGVDSPADLGSCRSGNCQSANDLVIDPIGRTGCISGTVYSELGLPPFPTAVIFTDSFTWTQTDAAGRFCLPVQPNPALRVMVVDPTSVLISGEAKSTELTLSVPDGDARCGASDEGCVSVTVGEPLPPEALGQCGQCGSGTAVMAPGVLAAFLTVRRRRRRRR